MSFVQNCVVLVSNFVQWSIVIWFFVFFLLVCLMFLDSYIAYIDVSHTLPNWLTQNKCTFIIFVLRPNQEIASFYKQRRRISLHLQIKYGLKELHMLIYKQEHKTVASSII